MNQRFSAKDFLAVLNKGELLEKPLVKQGMVKPAEKPDALMFNEGTQCGHWVRIPLDCIEEIEHLDTITCKDHHHPYVEISFKRPKDDNPLAKVFMGLASRPAVVEPESAPVVGRGANNFSRPRCPRYPPHLCYKACGDCDRTGNPRSCSICDCCYNDV